MLKVIMTITLLTVLAKADSDGMATYCARAKVDCATIKQAIKKKEACEPKNTVVVKEYFVREVPKFKHSVYLYGSRKIVDVDTRKSPGKATISTVSAIVPGLGYMGHTQEGINFGAAIDIADDVQLSIGLDF